MLNTSKAFLYNGTVDMRKAISGLSSIVVANFSIELLNSSSIFVFLNKYRDKAKLLYWDTNGFVLYYKRLEKGKFKPYYATSNVELECDELAQLLSGHDMELLAGYPSLQGRYLV